MTHRPLEVLLVARGHRFAWILPQMLVQAGFQVDLLTSSRLMKHCSFLRRYEYVDSKHSFLPFLQQGKKYDWIIIADEESLEEILRSSLPLGEKVKLLPVCGQENLFHLLSKIHLSELFSTANIPTPAFMVARHFAGAVLGAKQLGYPVLIKRDLSSGGMGIFACEQPSDFAQIPKEVFLRPVLVQKKISGEELDLSALFLEGELIHFSCARQEKVRRVFGPSFLRTYFPLGKVEEAIFSELQAIGKALGAHGFVNLSCIQTQDKRRFYFEADMRPNVWVCHCQFLGEDLASRIRNWFLKKETLQFPVALMDRTPASLFIPYFLRLKPLELLTNRYQVWKFIPKGNWSVVSRLLLELF